MRVFALEPTEVDLPFMRSLVVVQNTSSRAKMPDEKTTTVGICSWLGGASGGCR